MPKVRANAITINYDRQGTGEPLILIPYLAADYACYAFQVAEYAKHFTCISVDLRGAGETDKPEGTYTTELFADDVAAFMQALGIQHAHVAGLSLGAATGMWLAAKYPDKVNKQNIQHAELVIFEGCAHAPIYEKVDEFNQTTLEFLKRHAG